VEVQLHAGTEWVKEKSQIRINVPRPTSKSVNDLNIITIQSRCWNACCRKHVL